VVLNDRGKQPHNHDRASIARVFVRRNDAIDFNYSVSNLVQMFC